MTNKNPKLRMLVLGSLIVLNLAACNPIETPRSNVPLILAIIPDGIGSAKAQLPLSEAQLNSIVSILNHNGGITAFALIHDRDSQPLIRLKLSAVNGRLDERANKSLKNRDAIAKWQSRIKLAIARDREGKFRDFGKLLSRVALFMTERTLPPDGIKAILLIADERHTRGRNGARHPVLPPDVKVLVTGLEKPSAKKIFGQDALVFESAEAAIEALKHISVNGGMDDGA